MVLHNFHNLNLSYTKKAPHNIYVFKYDTEELIFDLVINTIIFMLEVVDFKFK